MQIEIKMPRVAIVVLNWNQAEDTCECLASVRQLDYSDYYTIVVDNGSVDGSPDIIAAQFPEVTLIRNSKNLGFVGGCNVGIDAALKAGVDYVFLLNNDTTVSPNLLTELARVAESDSQIAVVGPQTFYYDRPKTLWFFGANLKWPTAELNFWHQNEESPYPDGVVLDTDFVSGALLIRAATIRLLGALDPYFFIYWEDVELALRYARAGYKVKAVSSAHMWHKVSRAATGGRISKFFFARNQLYLCRKYNTFTTFWLRVVPALLYQRLRWLVQSRFDGSIWIGVRGMLSYFRGHQGGEFLDRV